MAITIKIINKSEHMPVLQESDEEVPACCTRPPKSNWEKDIGKLFNQGSPKQRNWFRAHIKQT